MCLLISPSHKRFSNKIFIWICWDLHEHDFCYIDLNAFLLDSFLYWVSSMAGRQALCIGAWTKDSLWGTHKNNSWNSILAGAWTGKGKILTLYLGPRVDKSQKLIYLHQTQFDFVVYSLHVKLLNNQECYVWMLYAFSLTNIIWYKRECAIYSFCM